MTPEQKKVARALIQFAQHIEKDIEFVHRGLLTKDEFFEGVEYDVEDLRAKISSIYGEDEA